RIVLHIDRNAGAMLVVSDEQCRPRDASKVSGTVKIMIELRCIDAKLNEDLPLRERAAFVQIYLNCIDHVLVDDVSTDLMADVFPGIQTTLQTQARELVRRGAKRSVVWLVAFRQFQFREQRYGSRAVHPALGSGSPQL